MSDEQHNRFVWAPIEAKPGQDPSKRRLGAELSSPSGEIVRGHLVQSGQYSKNDGTWNWSVRISRDWGVHFVRSGYTETNQEASDLANAAVPEVIAEAAAHDEQEVALWAILDAARRPEWTIPSLPIMGRDDRFLRRLQWRVDLGAKRSGRLVWPGYVALSAAIEEYLNR